MAARSVQAWLDDIRFLSEHNYAIVEAVRGLVKKDFKQVAEEVKYGGILFSSASQAGSEIQFCGVFAYKAHVSVEFGHGASIKDTFGHLEGAGKGRRHLKLRSLDDIKDKKLAQYLPLALQAAAAA